MDQIGSAEAQKKEGRMKISALILLTVLILSACGPCESSVENVQITKSFSPPSLGMCVKVGEIYVPSQGGTCAGMIENVPAKYYLHYAYDDGTTFSREVTQAEFASTSEGSSTLNRCK